MNIKINELPIYVISGAKTRKNPTDCARREVYMNEFKRIAALEVAEIPAIFDGHPSCKQYGLTKGHIKIWEDIIINSYKQAMICEDDVMFHDDFTTLFPAYCKAVEKDFLYVNIGGKFRAKKDRESVNFEEPVHKYPTFLTHAYLVSYEGAWSLLQHNYNIQRMPIFDKLSNGELKIDIQWKKWYDRLSTENKDRVYSFGSTPEIPAVWNGIEWYDDESSHVPSFCPSNGLAYQTCSRKEEYISKIDFHLRKTTTY